MNEIMFEFFKECLNFTHSNVIISNINLHNQMFFVFFNDKDKRIELHSDKSLFFKDTGTLSKNTIFLSVDYDKILNQKLKIEYRPNGDINNFEIGFHNPVFIFYKGDNETSHSYENQKKGLFVIKDAFKNYISVLSNN